MSAFVIAAVLIAAAVRPAHAQMASPFVFSVATPDADVGVGDSEPATAIADRALTLWGSAASDPGIGAEARLPSQLIVLSMKGTVDFVSDRHRYTSLQQFEVLRAIGAGPRIDLAVGGGVREEFGGARTVVGRFVASAPFAQGRVQANAVIEKTFAAGRDAADVITTFGWSRPVGRVASLGIEGIGQDLEGFFSQDEAEGGGRLLVGPSFHLANQARRWSFTVAGGPLLRSPSSVVTSDSPRTAAGLAGARGRYAVLGTFTCTLTPSR